MKEPVRSADKQPVNNLSLDSLEAMLAEEMEEQSLFGCMVNWSCDKNAN